MPGEFNWNQLSTGPDPKPVPDTPDLESLLNQIPDRNGEVPAVAEAPAPAQPQAADPAPIPVVSQSNTEVTEASAATQETYQVPEVASDAQSAGAWFAQQASAHPTEEPASQSYEAAAPVSPEPAEENAEASPMTTPPPPRFDADEGWLDNPAWRIESPAPVFQAPPAVQTPAPPVSFVPESADATFSPIFYEEAPAVVNNPASSTLGDASLDTAFEDHLNRPTWEIHKSEEDATDPEYFESPTGEAAHMPRPVPKRVLVAPEAPETLLYRESERAQVSEVGGAADLDGLHLDDILRLAIDRKASDTHLTVGLPPMIRMDGEIIPLPFKMLKGIDSRRLIYEVLSDEQIEKFETNHELDFSYGVRDLGRFRFNVYMQRGVVAAAIRSIPTRIPTFNELKLPDTIRDMCNRVSGLILVTGPTGSGKSTTIASMLDDINENMAGHIMTIEDPIEYLHFHKKCMVNQREMHSDTYSFHNALKAVLREDPDIILVGELRDLETIEAALTLAETGHLVFGTLHTRNAPATIDRIIDVFPSDQQDQIRVLLGNTLEGVISQQLLPKLGGGRVAAIEIMLGVPAVRNLVREGKTHQIYSIIETNRQVGMCTMDSSLAAHYRSGTVSYEECLMRAVDKENFARIAKSAA